MFAPEAAGSLRISISDETGRLQSESGQTSRQLASSSELDGAIPHDQLRTYDTVSQSPLGWLPHQ